MEKIPKIIQIINMILGISIGGFAIYKWRCESISTTEALACAIIITIIFGFNVIWTIKKGKNEEG